MNDREKYKDKLNDWLKSVEKTNVIIDEFNKIEKEILEKQKEYKPNTNYGDIFEIFSIAVLHRIPYKEVWDKHIVQGSGDGGIDAIVEKKEKTIIYQCKLDMVDFNTDIKEKMESSMTNLVRGRKVIAGNHLEDFWNSRVINKQPTFEYCVICENDSSRRGNRSSYIVSVESVYKKFFSNMLSKVDNKLHLKITVPGEDGKSFIATDNEDIFAFFVKANKLLEDLQELAPYMEQFEDYFLDNVRGFLSDKDNSNRGPMEKTIMTEPENFAMYNNGVTIIGENVTLTPDNVYIEMDNPIISNGQQTIMTLQAMGHKTDISNITILVIIKKDRKRSIRGNVARYTNSQRHIKNLDLLSLRKDLRTIQGKLAEEDNIFLKINSSGDKWYDELISKSYKRNTIIDLSFFIQAYMIYNDGDLGKWYNRLDASIFKEIMETKEFSFNLKQARMVCESICIFQENLQNIEDEDMRNDYQVASRVFVYIMSKYKQHFTVAREYVDEVILEYRRSTDDKPKQLRSVFNNRNRSRKIGRWSLDLVRRLNENSAGVFMEEENLNEGGVTKEFENITRFLMESLEVNE